MKKNKEKKTLIPSLEAFGRFCHKSFPKIFDQGCFSASEVLSILPPE